jgi:hypothetical protein
LQRRSGWVVPEKGAGDTIQKRRKDVRVQGTPLAAEEEEGQAAGAMWELLRAEVVANGSEVETGGM